MKITPLLIGLILVLAIPNYSNAQMINGGFEDFDSDDNNDGFVDDTYLHSIEYAVGWHNCPIINIQQGEENSCDHIHPQSLGVLGTPRTGIGCGRFGAVGHGKNEYCYGTTDPLTAGQLYSVSFWIRKDLLTPSDATIGAVISTSPAQINWDPFYSTLSPQVTVQNVGTSYQKVTWCFTPQSSTTHYISFGALVGYGGQESILYLIDDVSITAIPQGAPLPTANATLPQTTFCTGDPVVVNGSTSLNEDGYTWEVYQLVQGDEDFIYSSGPQTGQAGTFDVSAVLGFVSPGECYRVYLIADGLCPDETFIDFCYTDPEIEFLHDGSAVCENTPVSLTVTGENNWTYTWSSGQSGVGLKTVSVTPSIGNGTFTVDVLTPEGCTFSKSITLTVHSQNNLPPWMDGVNGTGDYTFYVNSDVGYPPFSFVSNFYNDHWNELLEYTQISSNFPNQTFFTIDLPDDDTPNGQMTFTMTTGGGFYPDTPPGNYYFTVWATDNNACANASAQFTFNIVVGCDYCPLCVEYNYRTPNTGVIVMNPPTPPSMSPLPPETNAIDCITAGLLGIVETGEDAVLFRAGNTIDLGSYFSAGPGFVAEIDPTTCITDCNACCSNFEGLSNNLYFPNAFSPNGDGLNDNWYVLDELNPYCAFNAQGFSLYIVNRWGNIVHKIISSNDDCCSFVSPSQNNPIEHSSIYWDGLDYYSNQPVTEGTFYFYILTLYGCGEEATYQGIIYLSDNGNRIANPNGETQSNPKDVELLAEIDTPENSNIQIFPNPARTQVQITGLEPDDWTVRIISTSGAKVLEFETKGDTNFNVSTLVSGNYLILITTETKQFFKKLEVL